MAWSEDSRALYPLPDKMGVEKARTEQILDKFSWKGRLGGYLLQSLPKAGPKTGWSLQFLQGSSPTTCRQSKIMLTRKKHQKLCESTYQKHLQTGCVQHREKLLGYGHTQEEENQMQTRLVLKDQVNLETYSEGTLRSRVEGIKEPVVGI